MILAHSLLRGNVAEHVTLLLIGSSHAPLDALCAASLQNFRVFQQPARRSCRRSSSLAALFPGYFRLRHAGSGREHFHVAKMLADTVDTVEKHYVHFVPAARRNAVQAKMDNGLGIEERAKLSKQRGRKGLLPPAISQMPRSETT